MYQKIVYIFIFLVAGCKLVKKPEINDVNNNRVWFQQERVELGARIDMLDENFGVAISRGKGNSVAGKVYLYNNGRWEVLSEHNYSDYPLIYIEKPNIIYWITHGSHHENYKPHLKTYDFKSIKEIALPKIMWDEKDFVMWRGISVLNSGKIYLAGQQGNIIYYENNKWSFSNNPFKRQQNESFNAKDLHDIQMFNESSGWAIGKSGLILKLKNSVWNKYSDITGNDLMKISFLNENFGWIVGKRGTILKYENNHFHKVDIELPYDLNSVKTISRDKAFIVGANSTLLELKNGKWIEDKSIKVFNDNFIDIDVAEKNGKEFIWIIGEKGIYTNYHDLKFSFTDVTATLTLRTEGRTGIFRDINSDGYSDLLTLLEDSPPILYKNFNGQTFSEAESYKEISSHSAKQVIVSADFDNDGNVDLLELSGLSDNQLLFGFGDFKFRRVNVKDFIKENIFESDMNLLSAQTVDFDNDGNLDVYISDENSSLLLRNLGAGKFENVFDKTGIKKFSNGNLSSVTFADFDNNNFIDVVVTYKIPINNKHIYLYLNKGNFQFVEKDDTNFYSKKSLNTYSSLANDFNNDGYTDLIIFNNENELKFLINDGNANFTNMVSIVGLNQKLFHPEPSCGILAAADVNNDGWLDLFIGSKLYLNSPKLYFNEIGKYIGIDFTGNPSFADYDNDGDVDLFIGSSKLALGEGIRATFYRNNSIKNNFVKVKLYGDKSNCNAIGAKVYLLGYNTNDSLVYITLRQNGLGGNALSQEDFSILHFGINPNLNYKLKVVFPSGIVKIINANKNAINEIYESTSLSRLLILMNKSIQRTFLLINWKDEVLKLLFLVTILLFVFVYGLKTKAKKFLITRWYVGIIFLIFYLIMVHSTVTIQTQIGKLLPIILTGSLAFIFVYCLSILIEKKESKFISHYKIIDIVGVGGTGKVFKAKDVNTSKIYALKVINPILLNDEDNRKLLSNEGRLLTKIDCENVVKVYEFGTTEKYNYLVMEYLSGGTLEEYIKRNFPIDLRKVLQIAKQISNGLIAIHKQNIIHRDLKSANIMFDENGNVKIMDFGLSKSPLVTTMTTLGTIMGTLGYVAPEQITNILLDERVDIFSFGVILYQMVTNRLPFTGSNEIAVIHSIFNTEPVKPSLLNSLVDNKLEEIILKCLKKNPDERFQSAEELLSQLEELIN